ncbi:MAG TPA: NAD(P)-dependent alcohol dehydrogenase, partial [Thermoplasmata archaeon]|nr:NAD(P)-dependent alcohol dehydrogenase [Thermoplasmata archaeon]
MKAFVIPRYGPPEGLELREFPNFTADEGELLVRVHAASVNALDWRRSLGSPWLVRLSEGLRRPRRPRLGVDFAGRVEALGKGATGFQPGDEVFGLTYGAFGEYASVATDEIARMPPGVSFEDSATLGIAAITALQALRDHGQVRPGHSVLIHGAGGGVGTFAVQLAKWMGAQVTATSRPETFEVLRTLGADRVLDYRKEDFGALPEKFDLILDLHPERSVSQYKQALKPGGIALTVGFARLTRLLRVAVRGKVKPRSGKKQVGFIIAKPTAKDLAL